MPTAIEKALDFIGGMNTSASVPHSMDESTAKGILKYLHDLGVPASPEAVMARGEQEVTSSQYPYQAKLEIRTFLMTSGKFCRSQII